MAKDTRLTNQNKRKMTLNIKLILVIIISFISAVILFVILRNIAVYYINTEYLSDAAVKERVLEKINDFAEYVEDEEINSKDADAILEWQKEEKNVYILVYKNKSIVYDSTMLENNTVTGGRNLSDTEYEKRKILDNIKNNRKNGGSEEKTDSTEASAEEQNPEETGNEETNYVFYKVKFNDGVRDVYIVDYSEETVYEFFMIVIFIFCCLFFIAAVLIYNSKVVGRVRKLTSEILRIETVDANAAITKNGNDEIFYLADSIDNMRNTIIDQSKREEEAWQANRNLVTAMAHDLRTPLTVLNGYLELLTNGDFESKEEMEQFLQICTDKVGQIRDLSDKLFKYFYVYTESSEELKLEEYDIHELFSQMIEEYVILLQEKGITFNELPCEESAKIRVDTEYLKRLFDNIFTNIRKYSDYDVPVDISDEVSGEYVILTIKNHISKNRNESESTKIGIKTCEKIAQKMNIKFHTEENKDVYTMVIEFPVVKE